ncbi:NO-inducible flavohemoprotein [Sutcliffiella halmapala]|uniref:NO-inducible flavohemoprotein n=1 Tax=Sutcliffiella halmapala TaxID=79882 RepID=UPI000994A3D8|nr:NO-inducible flavohemoprotein [Sutcliffiella halmapala]
MLSQKTIKIVKATAPVLAEKGLEITTHFYKRLFENHPELLNIFNHANQTKGRQQTALANTIYAAATYIDQLEVLLPAVKQIAHKHRSLQVKPEHYPIVGQHLLLAIKEVLGEAATEDIIEAWGEAYGVIAQVFIDVEKEMYTEAENSNNAWENFKSFKVVKKEIESSVITSFYLKPTDGTNVPAFTPGQYITIRLSIPGEQYLLNRQYSLSDTPNGEYYRISVKKEVIDNLPEGKVSNYLHNHLNIGDELELTAPAGDFTLQMKVAEPVYLISGGVGITPMLSMLKTIAITQPNRSTTFIHAAKNGMMHAFSKEVTESIEKIKDGKTVLVYETPTNEDRASKKFQFEGFITEEILKGLQVEASSLFYVCGPVPFMQAVVSHLENIGVPKEKIHYEFFGPAMELKQKETVTL